MTTQDYIALAKLIKNNTEKRYVPELVGGGKVKIIQVNSFIHELCQYLKSDNPNFNESKFREACGG